MKQAAFWLTIAILPLVLIAIWTQTPPSTLAGMPQYAVIAVVAGTALFPGVMMIVQRRWGLGLRLIAVLIYVAIFVLLTPIAMSIIGCGIGPCDL